MGLHTEKEQRKDPQSNDPEQEVEDNEAVQADPVNPNQEMENPQLEVEPEQQQEGDIQEFQIIQEQGLEETAPPVLPIELNAGVEQQQEIPPVIPLGPHLEVEVPFVLPIGPDAEEQEGFLHLQGSPQSEASDPQVPPNSPEGSDEQEGVLQASQLTPEPEENLPPTSEDPDSEVEDTKGSVRASHEDSESEVVVDPEKAQQGDETAVSSDQLQNEVASNEQPEQVHEIAENVSQERALCIVPMASGFRPVQDGPRRELAQQRYIVPMASGLRPVRDGPRLIHAQPRYFVPMISRFIQSLMEGVKRELSPQENQNGESIAFETRPWEETMVEISRWIPCNVVSRTLEFRRSSLGEVGRRVMSYRNVSLNIEHTGFRYIILNNYSVMRQESANRRIQICYDILTLVLRLHFGATPRLQLVEAPIPLLVMVASAEAFYYILMMLFRLLQFGPLLHLLLVDQGNSPLALEAPPLLLALEAPPLLLALEAPPLLLALEAPALLLALESSSPFSTMEPQLAEHLSINPQETTEELTVCSETSKKDGSLRSLEARKVLEHENKISDPEEPDFSQLNKLEELGEQERQVSDHRDILKDFKGLPKLLSAESLEADAPSVCSGKSKKGREKIHKRLEPSDSAQAAVELIEYENPENFELGEPQFSDPRELLKLEEFQDQQISDLDEPEFSDPRELLKEMNFGEMKDCHQGIMPIEDSEMQPGDLHSVADGGLEDDLKDSESEDDFDLEMEVCQPLAPPEAPHPIEDVDDLPNEPEEALNADYPQNPGFRRTYRNGRCADGETHSESVQPRQFDMTEKEFQAYIVLLFSGIIFIVALGTFINILSYTYDWRGLRTQNATALVTDDDFNVTTPLTTIYNTTSLL